MDQKAAAMEAYVAVWRQFYLDFLAQFGRSWPASRNNEVERWKNQRYDAKVEPTYKAALKAGWSHRQLVARRRLVVDVFFDSLES
jgi:hypothetical protein